MPTFSRSFWLRNLLSWHWISSALALAGMLMFAITGITLNRAYLIPASVETVTIEEQVPTTLLSTLKEAQPLEPPHVPPALLNWFQQQHAVHLASFTPQWSAQELYIDMPKAGGDAWLSIDLQTGEALYESTDRGWIAYLNDLHKGRNTGQAWLLFIDVFALICIVFCLTGLGLLMIHARQRLSIWPIAGFGLVVPVLLATLFIH